MGKRRKANAKQAPEGAGASEPFNNPFGALGGLTTGLPTADTPSPDAPDHAGAAATAETRPPLSDGWSIGGKVVLRHERKGHGGKPVTAISGLVLRGIEAAQLARELGKRLGCGARVDGDRILLAGDQRQRAADLLRGHGAKQIVVA